MAAHVELSVVAKHDLKRLGPGLDRKVVIDALAVGLTAIPPPGNLDIKALKGATPWLRLRVGNYRILYRPFTREELKPSRAGGSGAPKPATWSPGSCIAAISSVPSGRFRCSGSHPRRKAPVSVPCPPFRNAKKVSGC